MIELHFVKRAALRKIFIDDRVITMITPELSYQPMQITIKQLQMALASGDERIKGALEDAEVDLDKYQTDESIAEEIIKDFTDEGWRVIKR